jgi:hypothetical protein
LTVLWKSLDQCAGLGEDGQFPRVLQSDRNGKLARQGTFVCL